MTKKVESKEKKAYQKNYKKIFQNFFKKLLTREKICAKINLADDEKKSEKSTLKSKQ